MKKPSSAGLATVSPASLQSRGLLEANLAFGNRTGRYYSRRRNGRSQLQGIAGVSKIVIVTGGSRGIGRAAALAAAAAGYDVAISYRQERGAADDVVQRIRALDRRGLAVAADSADEGAVVSLFAEVDRQLGAVSALVNNAGIVGGSGRVEDMTADEVSRVLAINVTGCFTAAREAIKRMSTRRGGAGGSIVNISSAAARLAAPASSCITRPRRAPSTPSPSASPAKSPTRASA